MSKLASLKTTLSSFYLGLGLVLLLTSQLWIDSRHLYKNLIYASLVFPGLIVAISCTDIRQKFIKNPMVISIVLYIAYLSLSTLWADPSAGAEMTMLKTLKRGVYILMPVLTLVYLYHCRPEVFKKAAVFSLVIAALGCCYWLVYWYGFKGKAFSEIMIKSYGALGNRLFAGHLLGFLVVFFSAYLMTGPFSHKEKTVLAFALLPIWALIVFGGSRTALGATFLASILLVVLGKKQNAGKWLLSLALLGSLVIFLFWEQISARGLSYRPEIWQKDLAQMAGHWLIGYGYDTRISVYVESLNQIFVDAHNVFLNVLFYGGILGLGLYLWIYALGARCFFRKQSNSPLMLALLFYGVLASMTDGGGILSRPGPHWFNIWLPIMACIIFDKTYWQGVEKTKSELSQSPSI